MKKLTNGEINYILGFKKKNLIGCLKGLLKKLIMDMVIILLFI